MTDRPGIKTTEFWLSIAATTISAVAASGMLGGDALQLLGIAGAVLSSLGYTGARYGVKKAEANKR